MTHTFHEFTTRFQRITDVSDSKKFTLAEIQSMEDVYQIKLPSDYKEFMLSVGAISTPDLHNILLDLERESFSFQEFLSPERIMMLKSTSWSSKPKGGFIPFAIDLHDNMYAFKISDLKILKSTAPIYFYDCQDDTFGNVMDGLTKWLQDLSQIPK